MIEKSDDAFLAGNIKGLMMTLLARWNAEMDDARQATEFAAIRPADMRVFAQLRGREMPLSDIHREMGYSRQAAQQAVERLVAFGMLELRFDGANRRDKQVVITEKGQRWRALAAGHIRQIEGEIAELLGDADREALRDALRRLVGAKDVKQKPGT